MINKRKHHIIPVTYLTGFTDAEGKLYQYLKDKPLEPQYNIPRELGHRRDYYSQPLPNGEIDYNKVEDVFCEFESKWPSLVQKMNNSIPLSREDEVSLYSFLTLMKVRVPATRDGIEQMLAYQVKSSGDMLEKQGLLPPRPPELEGVELEISIDPHKSIHAMKDIAVGFNRIFESIKFKICKNNSGIPLITSDNPIVFFDFLTREKEMQPYARNLQNIEFIFPITSFLVLHGHSNYTHNSFSYDIIRNEKKISRFNRLICKFGYERIFSSTKNHEPLIKKHSTLSPILNIKTHDAGKGKLLLYGHEFGIRRKLPKWKND